MQQIQIDSNIKLIPYYRNDEISLAWYQDLDICKQVDNIDYPYDIEKLHKMYGYLTSKGDCYYIEYKRKLIGDISLQDSGEIAIVICKEYQNKHIGRKCVSKMLEIAKEKGMKSIKANIYSFNQQSQKMFLSIGFSKIEAELYIKKF